MSSLITAAEAAITVRDALRVKRADIAAEYVGHLRSQLAVSATQLNRAQLAGDQRRTDLWTGAVLHDTSLVQAAEQAMREAVS